MVIQGLLRSKKDAKKSPKIYVIDDSQYIMANEYFDRASEKGYDKFVDIGANFRNLVHMVNNELPDDVIVYFLHHPETDSNTGRLKAKTIGKMLDEKLCVEGCFDIVLFCQDQKFFTQSNGQSVAKTPEGMFELEIPNDLKAVDHGIRDYYNVPRPSTKAEEPKKSNKKNKED